MTGGTGRHIVGRTRASIEDAAREREREKCARPLTLSVRDLTMNGLMIDSESDL